MTEIDILFAGVAVADYDTAVDWYARLFGRSADVIVNDDEVMWHLAGSAWLYVVKDERRAGNALVTLSVSDLDGVMTDIGQRGITGGPIEIIGDAGRKATVVDAEGNAVAFIEVASSKSDPS
jgi:predicted enzyme related to lactoylglutathione lyase